MSRPSLAIVGDDLTGAVDAAHGFATRGFETTVVAIQSDDRDEGQDTLSTPGAVTGINTDSRYLDRSHAAKAVSEVIRRVGADTLYKKIDSTLRGNIAMETEAALVESNTTCAIVAPAFPATPVVLLRMGSVS